MRILTVFSRLVVVASTLGRLVLVGGTLSRLTIGFSAVCDVWRSEYVGAARRR